MIAKFTPEFFFPMQILSVVMISGGGISLNVTYSVILDSGLSTDSQILSIFWLVVGLMFIIVALFGIFVAFKEHTVLANLVR